MLDKLNKINPAIILIFSSLLLAIIYYIINIFTYECNGGFCWDPHHLSNILFNFIVFIMILGISSFAIKLFFLIINLIIKIFKKS